MLAKKPALVSDKGRKVSRSLRAYFVGKLLLI